MARIEPISDGRFQVRWRENGRDRRRTLKTRHQAEAVLTEVKVRLQREWNDARDHLNDLNAVLERTVGADRLAEALETVTTDPTSELGTAIRSAHVDERRAWDNISRA